MLLLYVYLYWYHLHIYKCYIYILLCNCFAATAVHLRAVTLNQLFVSRSWQFSFHEYLTFHVIYCFVHFLLFFVLLKKKKKTTLLYKSLLYMEKIYKSYDQLLTYTIDLFIRTFLSTITMSVWLCWYNRASNFIFVD